MAIEAVDSEQPTDEAIGLASDIQCTRMTVRERIDDFLAQKRIAMVGVSRAEKDFSRSLFREFVKRGYDIVPLNPAVAEVEGRKCFARLDQVQPAPDAVLLMTPGKVSEQVVQDCAAAGVKRVWLYRATGQGAVSEQAIDFCEVNGIEVIPGHCPFMFLPGTAFFHRFHGFLTKLTGSYPK